uniref:Uncharacterized protein n=1 Tax=Tetranychus urticae TaxID=32264 RepID=T1KMY7_TETUR
MDHPMVQSVDLMNLKTYLPLNPQLKPAKSGKKQIIEDCIIDIHAKSDSPRTAKKGYKYTIRLSKKNCLKCAIKKQCVFDLTKLHYRLSGPTVCEFLINMGLISLSHEKLAELRQKNREFYTSFPDENPEK